MSKACVPYGRLRLAAAAFAALAFTAAGAPPAAAQDGTSAAAAAELTRLLDGAKLDSIATVDPDNPDKWVAALYFKDAQLLVVSAQYPAPAVLAARMKERDYRDIYLALFSSAVKDTKRFVMDANADGLVARPSNNTAPDMWEARDETVSFDGEWRRARMSEAEYRKVFAEADQAYTRMLQLLAQQARGAGGGTHD